MKPFFFILALSGCISMTAQTAPNPNALPPRHAVYVQNFVIVPIVSYDVRVLDLGPQDGIILRIGTMYTFGASWYHGGPRQGFELGAISWDRQGVAIEGFYRYASAKGFLFKAGMSYVPEEEAIPTFGVGYTF